MFGDCRGFVKPPVGAQLRCRRTLPLSTAKIASIARGGRPRGAPRAAPGECDRAAGVGKRDATGCRRGSQHSACVGEASTVAGRPPDEPVASPRKTEAGDRANRTSVTAAVVGGGARYGRGPPPPQPSRERALRHRRSAHAVPGIESRASLELDGRCDSSRGSSAPMSGEVVVPAASKGGCGVPGGGNNTRLRRVHHLGDTFDPVLRCPCADLALALRSTAPGRTAGPWDGSVG